MLVQDLRTRVRDIEGRAPAMTGSNVTRAAQSTWRLIRWASCWLWSSRPPTNRHACRSPRWRNRFTPSQASRSTWRSSTLAIRGNHWRPTPTPTVSGWRSINGRKLTAAACCRRAAGSLSEASRGWRAFAGWHAMMRAVAGDNGGIAWAGRCDAHAEAVH